MDLAAKAKFFRFMTEFMRDPAKFQEGVRFNLLTVTDNAATGHFEISGAAFAVLKELGLVKESVEPQSLIDHQEKTS